MEAIFGLGINKLFKDHKTSMPTLASEKVGSDEVWLRRRFLVWLPVWGQGKGGEGKMKKEGKGERINGELKFF